MTLATDPAAPADQVADADALAARIEDQMAEIVDLLEQWRVVSGNTRVDVGLGTSPAIVVIDLARFWTVEGYAAYAPESGPVLDNVAILLRHARAAGVPVIFTTQAYQSYAGGLVSATGMDRKFPGSSVLAEGSDAVALHESLTVEEGEHLLTKTQSSAFAHTHLGSMLHNAGIDTVIITGVVTSGCVRATAADSLANGFRTVVVPECVSDVLPGATRWTLFDVTTKIGDVVPLAEVIEYIEDPARIAAGSR